MCFSTCMDLFPEIHPRHASHPVSSSAKSNLTSLPSLPSRAFLTLPPPSAGGACHSDQALSPRDCHAGHACRNTGGVSRRVQPFWLNVWARVLKKSGEMLGVIEIHPRDQWGVCYMGILLRVPYGPEIFFCFGSDGVCLTVV